MIGNLLDTKLTQKIKNQHVGKIKIIGYTNYYYPELISLVNGFKVDHYITLGIKHVFICETIEKEKYYWYLKKSNTVWNITLGYIIFMNIMIIFKIL
ncbi:hypothetical protein Hokovirus_4_10 [Hokovirus HKV1]|uniref:Uncharacterized protein n=1 Tax=Hokovirus HKV1 TaxID=1977638 RepID=A0A1V0SH26_9VIRU|nr:hypothetical protein Hokovirus_4_10 [Hokovirus HKV1]